MFLELDCLEAFYGGAAAGGKSDSLLMAALQYVHVPGYSALILRRDFRRLNLAGAIMDRSKMWLKNTDAIWNDMAKRWTFPSGATIEFGYIDSPDDRYRYASAEYSFVGFDELTEFRLPDNDSNPYQFMFSRLRKTRDIDVPLRMRSASNPGNIGHRFVRQRFVTDAAVIALLNGESGVLDGPGGRKFVPARVRDNPAIDPEEYEKSLSHLGAVTRARLMRGDWTVSEGTQIDPSWMHYYELNGSILKFGNNGSTVVEDERTCQRFAVIDTAGTSKEKAAEDRGRPPSWSVCGVYDHSRKSKTLYRRHVGRWQVGYPELKQRVKQTLLTWKPPKCYVENAHFGPALVADLRLDRELQFVKFEMLSTKLPGMKADGEGAKLERATAAGLFDELEHGRLRSPSGPETPAWVSEHEAELSAWTGRSEETADQIDVDSYACYVTRRAGGTWAGKGVVAGGGFRR